LRSLAYPTFFYPPATRTNSPRSNPRSRNQTPANEEDVKSNTELTAETRPSLTGHTNSSGSRFTESFYSSDPYEDSDSEDDDDDDEYSDHFYHQSGISHPPGVGVVDYAHAGTVDLDKGRARDAIGRSGHGSGFRLGLNRRKRGQLPPIIWRMIIFQLAFVLTQIFASISTIVDVARHRPTPSPFGTQHIALLGCAWGPLMIFGYMPAVRGRLGFWKRWRLH